MKSLLSSIFRSASVRLLCAPAFSLVLVLLGFAAAAHAQANVTPSQLVVDLSAHTGAILHGASGWLYGQAEDGIPTDNMMTPLKPQIAAQKAPEGLQHPAGDAISIAPAFRRVGGKDIEIYLQDIYPNWPYDKAGIDDYVQKVQAIVRKVIADPNHELYSYVPFNEPDNNWYGYSGVPFQSLLNDWKTVYQAIRAIDPKARIIGPNFEVYRSAAYRQFFIFARDNHVLPDQTSWHELQDDFFAGWEDRYNDYRSIESSLGIAPLPIVINEYARDRGDLAIPGKMVPWIAHLENQKVFGCLAYWVPSGGLSDLVARSWANRPTAAWWLFKWYGGMTGDTVSVTPPDPYGFGLKGFAAVNDSTRQARIVFGGGSGTVNVAIQGLDKAPFFGKPVHVTAWSIPTSGTQPTKGPVFAQQADYTPSVGRVVMSFHETVVSSAYYLIVTPAKNHTEQNQPNRYEAEYADLSGSAKISYGVGSHYTGTGFVEGFSAAGNAATEFVVSAREDGYYDLILNYAAPARAGQQLKVGLSLNAAPPKPLALSATSDANAWASQKQRYFLAGGINRFSFQSLPDGSSNGLRIDSIDLAPSSGEIATYAVDNPTTTLAGTAKLTTVGKPPVAIATQIGMGDKNFLQFNRVIAPSPGTYKMIVSYINSEQGHKGQVERFALISVNGAEPKKVYFRNTFSSSVIRTNVIDVELKSGENTIRFSNPQGNAPDIALIQIATP